MSSRLVHAGAASAVLALVLASSALASAQGASTHRISDAFYLGGRLEPDGAWLVAYDLDVLVTDPGVGLSLGPSVSFAFGADGGTQLGRHQEWLLAADVARARLSLLSEHGARLMAVVGVGAWVASLPEQSTATRTVMLADGTTTTTSERFASDVTAGALTTVGAAADWYWDGHWALSAYLLGHIRLDDENRMPGLWLELGLGIRLGS